MPLLCCRLGHNDWVDNVNLTNAIIKSDFAAAATEMQGVGSSITSCLNDGLNAMVDSKLFTTIYVSSLAPLDKSPYIINIMPALFKAISSLPFMQANTGIASVVRSVNMTSVAKGTVMKNIDFYTTVNDALKIPPAPIALDTISKGCLHLGTLGFEPAPPVLSQCSDASTFFFYDDLHPTTLVHEKVCQWQLRLVHSRAHFAFR